MLPSLKKGAVLVDVAIDQGGCFETSRPPHDHPVFEIDGVLHYCVANMPGAVPLTSTLALTNATLPMPDSRQQRMATGQPLDDPGIGKGINMANTARSPARQWQRAFSLPYAPLGTILSTPQS